MRSLFLLAFLFSLMPSVMCKKVLLVSASSTSHCIEMMSIGTELLQRGHHVTLFVALDQPKCVARFNATRFPNFRKVVPVLDPSVEQTVDDTMAKGQKRIFEKTDVFTSSVIDMRIILVLQCESIFYDKNVLGQLEKERFDIAVVDALFFVSCLYALPYYLEIPTVALSSYIDNQDARIPLQTNTFPGFFTTFSNEMSFAERLINTISFFLNPVARMIMVPQVDLGQFHSKLESLNPLDLIKESILFLENSDYVIDYPKALFPNFVQVGGLSASPANPLPTELKTYVDQSKTGVVLVTFGSMFDSFPDNILQKLFSALSRLDQSVLFKSNKEEVIGNIKTMKWIPQNDILGHPNTKLFLSHCGKNGFWESLYHAVPIVCVPIHAETYITEVKVKKYGIGSSINIFDDSIDKIVETMKHVLENKGFSDRMKRISTLLRDRPETPAQRGATAIEHVLKYGGDHMRPPSVNFGFLGYTNLDVWIVLFGMDFVIILFFVWLVRRCCCRGKATKSKTE